MAPTAGITTTTHSTREKADDDPSIPLPPRPRAAVQESQRTCTADQSPPQGTDPPVIPFLNIPGDVTSIESRDGFMTIHYACTSAAGEPYTFTETIEMP